MLEHHTKHSSISVPVSTDRSAAIHAPPPCCWTILTCGRPMDGEARRPARATIPEIRSPTCLPHEQLGLAARGWRARLGKNWVSMKATPSLRRGEAQLATGAQVYTTPGQGERKGGGGRHNRPAETIRIELPTFHQQNLKCFL